MAEQNISKNGHAQLLSRSAIEIACDLAPEQILALSKVVPKTDCDDARGVAGPGVYQIDFAVRIRGDLQVGERELRRETLNLEELLLAALSKLTSPERARIYKSPAISETNAAILGGELEALKVALPRHYAAGKLTAHLVVSENTSDDDGDDEC